MMRRPVCAVVLLACLALPAGTRADPFSAALAALRAGQTVAGAQMFHDLAQAGDGEAMYNLALLYHQGLGLPRNGELALYWAWRARLAAVAPAPALIGVLAQEATPAHRAAVHTRLMTDIATGGRLSTARGFMEQALVEEGLADKPDAVQLSVWWAMAVALGEGQALPRRDAALAALSAKEATEAEERLMATFGAWCAAAQLADHPAICAPLSAPPEDGES